MSELQRFRQWAMTAALLKQEARELGITIPPAVFARATDVIE